MPPASSEDTTDITPATEYAEGFFEESTGISQSCSENDLRGIYRGRSHHLWDNADDLSEHEDFLPDTQTSPHNAREYTEVNLEKTRGQPDCIDRRTLLLCNLAEGARHADITAAVRGGQLVDIYMWYNDRKATISFCHGPDAADFYKFVCKHDLYIKQKRVGNSKL